MTNIINTFMAITSTVLSTPIHKIPSWKGTDILPGILVLVEDAPVISGLVEFMIPFHCSETVDRDARIENSEKMNGTVFDDQE